MFVKPGREYGKRLGSRWLMSLKPRGLTHAILVSFHVVERTVPSH